MKDRLAAIVAELPADHADIRFEENRKVRILYEGEKLRDVASTTTAGGHARVYANGGKAVSSFSESEKAAEIATSACASARRAGTHREKGLRIAPAPPITDAFPIRPPRDPRKISLQEKLELAAHYNAIILAGADVATTQTLYDEFASRRVFVDSEGSVIEYDVLTCGIAGTIVTKKGSVVQRVRFAFGGCEDYDRLLDREEDLRKRIEKAGELLDAEPVKAGIYPVVLDPSEAGVFVHEAFGHLSEGDGLQNNPAFRARLQMGTKLGREILNVSDDPGLDHRPGSLVVDDEGVRAVKNRLTPLQFVASEPKGYLPCQPRERMEEHVRASRHRAPPDPEQADPNARPADRQRGLSPAARRTHRTDGLRDHAQLPGSGAPGRDAVGARRRTWP